MPLSTFQSGSYWEQRYVEGGNPGKGSRGRLARFKSEVINAIVKSEDIKTAIEWGCGPGDQFARLKIPYYTGIDVSPQAIATCQSRFRSLLNCDFFTCAESGDRTAELALSLDVIYHLVEDEIFATYMRRLFGSATRFVLIYSTDRDVAGAAAHVRHRQFSSWVEKNAPEWELMRVIPQRYPNHERVLFFKLSGSPCDFFLYKHR